MNFKDLIVESKQIDKELRLKFPEVRFVSNESDNIFILTVFVIQDKRRGKGEAKAFIKYLIELANKYNKSVYLTPTDVYEADLSRLKKFYKKMGFIKNTDKIPEKMIYKGDT